MTQDSSWSLVGFVPALDAWIEREHPLHELSVVVTGWLLSRGTDPFLAARRQPGFEDYWLAVIPGSEHFDDHAEWCAVVCSYWIDVPSRSVRCDQIASLSLPIS